MTPIKTVIVPGRPGLLVRKPDADGGGHLAAEGEAVHWCTYWQRRLDDGDVAVKKADRAAARATKTKE